jgi:hypothetical protein
MKNPCLAVLVFVMGVPVSSLARADIYKCPGRGDTITLSNVEKGAGCKKMVLPVETKRATQQKPKTEQAKEVKATDKPKSPYDAAAAERKRVLQEEIDLERTRLNTVQSRIRELDAVGSKTPDQVKELVGLQQKERLHQSNLQLLQKELNR